MSRKIFFAASSDPKAQNALAACAEKYPSVPINKADLIVALGGDGFMLETLHKSLPLGIPVYGMNLGSIGFLMNDYRIENLMDRLSAVKSFSLFPLQMQAETKNGEVSAYAFNEVSLLRETRQAAKIRIRINGTTRLEEMISDGIMVSTAAGSTAYNLSAHGPIIPIAGNVLALTPISPFRPRGWRGALLMNSTEFDFEIINPEKRPVSAVADFTEVRDISRVTVRAETSKKVTILFDPNHTLEERVLKEQFKP